MTQAEEELHEQILLWLSRELTESSSSVYDSKLEEREEGTCGWFWENSQVKDWLSGRSGILWVYGAPGIGKSVLSSSIISKLVEDGEVVAYFFCVFSRLREADPDSATRKPNSPESILRSLIVQLLESDRSWRVPDRLKEFYKRHKRPGASPIGLTDLRTILRCILDMYPCSYIIIDGLDELDESGQDTPNQLKPLLKILDLDPLGVVKWLLVSRQTNTVDKTLDRFKTGAANRTVAYRELDLAEVDLQLRDEIKTMVKAALGGRFSTLPCDWEHFLDYLVDKTEGNFLCARLLLDDLKDCLSFDQCVHAAADHKPGLAHNYLWALRRMASVKNNSWVTVAR